MKSSGSLCRWHGQHTAPRRADRNARTQLSELRVISRLCRPLRSVARKYVHKVNTRFIIASRHESSEQNG